MVLSLDNAPDSTIQIKVQKREASKHQAYAKQPMPFPTDIIGGCRRDTRKCSNKARRPELRATSTRAFESLSGLRLCKDMTLACLLIVICNIFGNCKEFGSTCLHVGQHPRLHSAGRISASEVGSSHLSDARNARCSQER